MTRSHKILGFIFVVLVGVYGCAKGPIGTGTEKNSSADSRVQRLEEDLRATAAARDQFRQKLLAAEERQTQIQRQFDHERETLKSEVKARLLERDSINAQYDSFRKNLKELIAQAEGTSSAPSLSQPTPIGANVAPMPTETSTVRN